MKYLASAIRNTIPYSVFAFVLFAAALFANPAANDDQWTVAAAPK